MKKDFSAAAEMYQNLPLLLQASLITGLILGSIGYITGFWYTKEFNTMLPLFIITYVTLIKDSCGLIQPFLMRYYSLRLTGAIAIGIAILDIAMLYAYILERSFWILMVLYVTVIPIAINNQIRAKLLRYYLQETGVNIARYDLVMSPVFSLANLVAAGTAAIISSLVPKDYYPWVILGLTVLQIIPEIWMYIIIQKTGINIKGKEVLDSN